MKERTVTIAKLACHVSSKGKLRAKIKKIELFFLETGAKFVCTWKYYYQANFIRR